MSGLTSIRVTGDKIEIIDQLKLPHTTAFIEIDSIEQAHDAIKTMKVQTQSPSAKDHTVLTYSYNDRSAVLPQLPRSPHSPLRPISLAR